MNTVMAPSAVRNSFKSCALKELPNIDCDEAFYFQYPSSDALTEMNGDGDLMEIWDISTDLSSVVTARGEIQTTPETEVYYR